MFVAWRDLRFARGRFALIGAVVGMLSVLVGFLSGLTGGLAFQNVSGVLALPGDRIVFSSSAPGATPGFSDSAVTEEQAETWSDDANVTPLGVSQVRAQTDDARVAVAVFGLDDSPLSPEPGFITLSVAAAKQLQVESGQDVTIAGQTFTVAEISGDAWYSHSPVVQTTIEDWRNIAAAQGTPDAFATALLISGSGDWDALDAAAGTESMGLVSSLTTLPAFRSEIGSLLLIVSLLFGISALVVGAFFSVWTMQRKTDIAVLKALGATTGSLLRDALGQSLIVLVVGTAAGMGLVIVAALALGDSLPFLLSPLTTLVPSLLMIALGLLGAIFALRTVTVTDPLTALGSSR